MVQAFAPAVALYVAAPICVLLNVVPLPRWTAPRWIISFGTYFYALPIQHLTVDLPCNFWLKGLIAFSTTLLAGTLSALLIERPMLQFRKRLKPLSWSFLSSRFRANAAINS